MSRDLAKKLQNQFKTEEIGAVCRGLLEATTLHALNEQAYLDYKKLVVSTFGESVQDTFIAGSANWGFSLNPRKEFRTFGDHSDIDLCIISETLFNEAWENVRAYHRAFYYTIKFENRKILARHGQDIYSGFVSPSWIPSSRDANRIAFEKKLNTVRSSHVNYKRVEAFIFRNFNEAIDYYKRSLINLSRERL